MSVFGHHACTAHIWLKFSNVSEVIKTNSVGMFPSKTRLFFANVFRRHYESLSLLKENKSINRKTEKIDFSRTSKFKESTTNVRKLSAQLVNKCDAVGAGSDTRLICRYLMRWKQTPSQMLSALRNSICTVNVHIIFGPRPNNNLKNK